MTTEISQGSLMQNKLPIQSQNFFKRKCWGTHAHTLPDTRIHRHTHKTTLHETTKREQVLFLHSRRNFYAKHHDTVPGHELS